MNDLLKRFDAWFEDTGPAALVIREHLMPVEGHDGVLFPPTFAATEDKSFSGGYNVDDLPDGKNICLVDTVGSQANRIEPMFSKEEYAGLVPQIVIKAGEKSVNLLEAGHRAGDAIVRCSTLQPEIHGAFQALINRKDAEPLARIAPTSLVFGAWDSRGTYAKLPRLIASTIRAYDVHRLTRSAQYTPATEYVREKLLEAPPDDKTRELYSKKGFQHALASSTPGGVIATGGIRRDASLHLAALRLLAATDEDRTLALRRYVLGLALTAFTYPPAGYLRQGCNLVRDAERKSEVVLVHGDGRRLPFEVAHPDALAYAREAAKAFVIGSDREVPFDKERAKNDLARGNDEGDGEKKPKKAAAKKAK